MKARYKMFVASFATLAMAFWLVPNSQAECGGFLQPLGHRTSWHPQYGQAYLLPAAVIQDDEAGAAAADVSIVGFWHVKFYSDGITTGIPGGIPKGTEIDAGYAQWHSDGTEINNSGGRAPNTENFCLGVWEKVGWHQYKLNHFATSWDPTKGTIGPAGPSGELIGPTNIRELVTLSAGGENFVGSFTIDNYDEAGLLLSHLQGKITGTRITVNTKPSSVF
jgi:hypothetical protein